MDKIKIVAAVLDTEQLVLYKEDGNTVSIRQGDPRVKPIIDEVTTPLSTQGWAEVSLEVIDPDTNVYREFQEIAGSVIRFFRVHKDELKNLFEAIVEQTTDNGDYGRDKHLVPVSLGNVPPTPFVAETKEALDGLGIVRETSDEAPKASDIRDGIENEKPSIEEATQQIIANAQPVTDPAFSAADTREDQTMIAVVQAAPDGAGGEAAPVIVPGMEQLAPQFARAVKLGSAKGATAFLQRLAAIINQRKHTIDELLNFMSKGDLPIADDGSILAYKVLTTGYGEPKGYYVDCHSKQVRQRIGSFVRQLHVDESRRTECSTGLHIARRGYLGAFSGNVIVLVKIAPEDVIAVPLGEPNKMRAAGYHILSEVPVSEHSVLRSNNRMEGTEAKKLLAMAIAGQHIDVIEEVVIGGPKGTEVKAVAKPAEEVKVAKAPKPRKSTGEAEAIDVDKKPEQAPAVDAKAVSEQVVAEKNAPDKPESRTDKAARLLKVMNGRNPHNERRQAAIELAALKKQSKIGWDKLGLDPKDVDEVARLSASEEKQDKAPKPVEATAPEPAPKKAPARKPEAGTRKKEAEPAPAPTASVSAPKPSPFKLPKEFDQLNRGQKARVYLDMIEGNFSEKAKRQAYQDLLALKKASKVGWGQLGVDNFDAIQQKFEGK